MDGVGCTAQFLLPRDELGSNSRHGCLPYLGEGLEEDWFDIHDMHHHKFWWYDFLISVGSPHEVLAGSYDQLLPLDSLGCNSICDISIHCHRLLGYGL